MHHSFRIRNERSVLTVSHTCPLPSEEELNIGLRSEDLLTVKIDIAFLRVVSHSLVILFSSQNWNETRTPCF